MDERVFAAFSGEVNQVGPKRGPGRFIGEARNVLIDQVEFGQLLPSNCLFGSGLEAVGVPPDGVE
jgi:hypothetical protein